MISYMGIKKQSDLIEAESKMIVTRGWGYEGKEEMLTQCTKLQLYRMNKSTDLMYNMMTIHLV